MRLQDLALRFLPVVRFVPREVDFARVPVRRFAAVFRVVALRVRPAVVRLRPAVLLRAVLLRAVLFRAVPFLAALVRRVEADFRVDAFFRRDWPDSDIAIAIA